MALDVLQGFVFRFRDKRKAKYKCEHADDSVDPESTRGTDAVNEREERARHDPVGAPHSQGGKRHRLAANFRWVDFGNQEPNHGPKADAKGNDVHDDSVEHRFAGLVLMESEANKGQSQTHARGAKEKQKAAAVPIDENDRDNDDKNVDYTDDSGRENCRFRRRVPERRRISGE